MKGSEPVLVVAEIGPVSAQFAPFMEPDDDDELPEDELPEPAEEPLPVQHDEDDELPAPEELPLPEPVVHCPAGVFDADTLWTPDCP